MYLYLQYSLTFKVFFYTTVYLILIHSISSLPGLQIVVQTILQSVPGKCYLFCSGLILLTSEKFSWLTQLSYDVLEHWTLNDRPQGKQRGLLSEGELTKLTLPLACQVFIKCFDMPRSSKIGQTVLFASLRLPRDFAAVSRRTTWSRVSVNFKFLFPSGVCEFWPMTRSPPIGKRIWVGTRFNNVFSPPQTWPILYCCLWLLCWCFLWLESRFSEMLYRCILEISLAVSFYYVLPYIILILTQLFIIFIILWGRMLEECFYLTLRKLLCLGLLFQRQA